MRVSDFFARYIKVLAQCYVDLMMKLGLVRFSILQALVLILLAIVVQTAVTLLLQGTVTKIDLIRAIFFGLLITPWVICFLFTVVGQLESSRQRLSRLVSKLERMRKRDQELYSQLQSNIEKLNQEIADRKKAESSREQLMEKLQVEIAQREQAQDELNQQSALLRSFLDASPDLVYYRNDKGEFSGCNRAMELLLGMREKELIGLTPAAVYSAEVAEKVIETDEKVFRHNVLLTYEQWLNYPDGRKVCFEIRKVPFYDRIGKRHGLMGFGRDITERKRYQDALENVSKDKTTFISTISHELRTPLNGIVGLSRILLDTELTVEQRRHLKTLYVSAITLGNIFNDIIEMDRLERRKISLDPQPVEFSDFLIELEDLSRLLVQPKGLQFTLRMMGELPDSILVDATRLRQILWNLISNAVKFTEQGKITVRVSYQHQSEQLQFIVEDSGIGIHQDELEKIFAMYYQALDKTGGKPATGTGIGLAISKRLAQVMGGDISAKSEVGVGSCFTIQVHAPVSAEFQKEEQRRTFPPLKILLVEDIELNIIVARSVLEKLGQQVDVAMTGKEALMLFQPGKYDLLLLDIQLPDMSGFDIVQSLRETYPRASLPPLVALTANVLKDKKEYLAAGMDDVLSKPLSVPALIAVLQHITSEKGKEQEAGSKEDVRNEDELLLDTELLEQYIELVGKQFIEQNLLLFEQVMPGYLTVLESNLVARDQKGISEEAHKIKGATGTLGLLYLQQLAQQIQNTSLPAWWKNVPEWIDELRSEWRAHVQHLHSWLEDEEKK